jgi:hypothetical protein
MESLPNELKHEILVQLDYESLINVCQINVTFRQICHDDSLWRRLFQRHYPTRHHNDQISWRQNYVQCRRYDHLETFAETFLTWRGYHNDGEYEYTCESDTDHGESDSSIDSSRDSRASSRDSKDGRL